MKRTLIAAGFAVAALSAQAQTARDGVFNHAEGRQTISNYENHYNSRLNKCIYLETRDTTKVAKHHLEY
jgi:hypothetical protein